MRESRENYMRVPGREGEGREKGRRQEKRGRRKRKKKIKNERGDLRYQKKKKVC